MGTRGGPRPNSGRPVIGAEIKVRMPNVWVDELRDLAEEMNTNRQHLIREALYAMYGNHLSEAHYGRTRTRELPKPSPYKTPKN
jgi:hypothetical protein